MSNVIFDSSVTIFIREIKVTLKPFVGKLFFKHLANENGINMFFQNSFLEEILPKIENFKFSLTNDVSLQVAALMQDCYDKQIKENFSEPITIPAEIFFPALKFLLENEKDLLNRYKALFAYVDLYRITGVQKVVPITVFAENHRAYILDVMLDENECWVGRGGKWKILYL